MDKSSSVGAIMRELCRVICCTRWGEKTKTVLYLICGYIGIGCDRTKCVKGKADALLSGLWGKSIRRHRSTQAWFNSYTGMVGGGSCGGESSRGGYCLIDHEYTWNEAMVMPDFAGARPLWFNCRGFCLPHRITFWNFKQLAINMRHQSIPMHQLQTNRTPQ